MALEAATMASQFGIYYGLTFGMGVTALPYTLQDDVQRLTEETLYYSTRSIEAGRKLDFDSNENLVLIDFTVDWWFRYQFPSQNKTYLGGFLIGPGVFQQNIEPLIDPNWWLSYTLWGVEEFATAPRWSVPVEQTGDIMHAQINCAALYIEAA